jgi:hypothetical protein
MREQQEFEGVQPGSIYLELSPPEGEKDGYKP